MLENHPTVVSPRPRIARPAPAELHGPARVQRGRRLRPDLRWRLGTLVLLCALLVALVLAVPGLGAVRQEIDHLDPVLVALAIGLEVASCVSFVVVFRLFFDRLPAGDARLLAWSEEGSGALLPGGGAGGLAIGGWLIHRAAICLKAVGATPSLLTVILAYNLGYLASALPVPGGIGVLDAGLVGALVVYGVSPTHAAAAVLVYRAIAMWIPAVGGLLAYLRLRPRLTR